MSYKIRRVEYFYTTVSDRPGEAYKLLSLLKDVGVNLHAFTAVPMGTFHTQLAVFPEDDLRFQSEARKAGLTVFGPNPALLVQGDDEMGALVDIHEKLYQASVNVYSATGVSDGKGDFGYLLYVSPEQIDKALKALDL